MAGAKSNGADGAWESSGIVEGEEGREKKNSFILFST